MKRALVTGASGFIGHHLCKYLKDKGYWVRAVDYKEPEFGRVACDEYNWHADLRSRYDAVEAFKLVPFDEVYALAADMGGAGFVFTGEHDYTILMNNVTINRNTLAYARGVGRILFTSSACVYPEGLQDSDESKPLTEEDAYPADPDSEYGWEKLFAERLYSNSPLNTRIARFHNIYGPEGSWNDGREKLPAAACRKVAHSELTGDPEVEVWGDGQAVRSFCYIDDCLEMLYRLMQSSHAEPLNIGTDVAIAVDDVFYMIAKIAGIEIDIKHIEGPQGVRKRNADLSRMRKVLDYEPEVTLEEGLERTYTWVKSQVELSLE